MTTGDRADLLFLYAAGALEGTERDEVETWLASGGPDAAAQLAAAEDEIARIAAAQPPLRPSERVRERLLARIGAQRATRAPAPRRTHPLLAAGLGAALAAGVAAVAMLRHVQQDEARDASLAAEVDSLREEIAQLAEERDALDAELADTEARLRQLESDFVLADKTIDVLHAEHAESLALTGTAAAPAAQGRVFWDWDSWYCYLRAAGLAKEPGRIYAIWLFTEDDVIGVGTFRADAEGKATFLGPVPHDVGHVLRAVVSVEPDEDLGTRPRGEVVMQALGG